MYLFFVTWRVQVDTPVDVNQKLMIHVHSSKFYQFCVLHNYTTYKICDVRVTAHKNLVHTCMTRIGQIVLIMSNK